MTKQEFFLSSTGIWRKVMMTPQSHGISVILKNGNMVVAHRDKDERGLALAFFNGDEVTRIALSDEALDAIQELRGLLE